MIVAFSGLSIFIILYFAAIGLLVAGIFFALLDFARSRKAAREAGRALPGMRELIYELNRSDILACACFFMGCGM
ncbi:MAG: hypothetical protein AAF492_17015, partial [Verrucomicrobiota bacterium]